MSCSRATFRFRVFVFCAGRQFGLSVVLARHLPVSRFSFFCAGRQFSPSVVLARHLPVSRFRFFVPGVFLADVDHPATPASPLSTFFGALFRGGRGRGRGRIWQAQKRPPSSAPSSGVEMGRNGRPFLKWPPISAHFHPRRGRGRGRGVSALPNTSSCAPSSTPEEGADPCHENLS